MRGSPPIPGIPGDLGVDFKGDFFFFERRVSVPPATWASTSGQHVARVVVGAVSEPAWC